MIYYEIIFLLNYVHSILIPWIQPSDEVDSPPSIIFCRRFRVKLEACDVAQSSHSNVEILTPPPSVKSRLVKRPVDKGLT